MTICAFFIWCKYGTISLSIDAQGIVLPRETIEKANALIEENYKEDNERIYALKSLYDKKRKLFAKHYVTVNDLLNAQTDYRLAEAESDNPTRSIHNRWENMSFYKFITQNSINTQLDVLVFVNAMVAKKILIGMRAFVLPLMISAYDYGYIKGEVIDISLYPVTKKLTYTYLGNVNLVDTFFADGVPFIAHLRLKKNETNHSGLDWTTKSGPDFAIQPGTIVTTKIIYKKCSPLNLIKKVCDR